MKNIDFEDILFTVVYERNYSDFSGGHDFSKNDTFDGLDDFKYELDSHAESINGYYEIVSCDKDIIAIQFYAMSPESVDDEDLFIDSGYIDDYYIEVKCSLREGATHTICDVLQK